MPRHVGVNFGYEDKDYLRWLGKKLKLRLLDTTRFVFLGDSGPVKHALSLHSILRFLVSFTARLEDRLGSSPMRGVVLKVDESRGAQLVVS